MDILQTRRRDLQQTHLCNKLFWHDIEGLKKVQDANCGNLTAQLPNRQCKR